MKLKNLYVDGTLEIKPTEDIAIEVENLFVNTGLSILLGTGHNGNRVRREIFPTYDGKLIIGTEQEPVPCDVTVEIKMTGNWTHTEEWGTLGEGAGAVPLGETIKTWLR